MSSSNSRGGGPLTLEIPTTTAFEFSDWPTQHTLGSCYGLVVRSMGVGRGILASWRSLAGGEVKQYTALLEESRRHAVERMVKSAKEMGGNAIVGIRFDSSEMGNGMTEVLAYGTAIFVDKD